MSDIERPYRPATNLHEPESEYVKERLQGTSWENREEIELLRIERWALDGASGAWDGRHSSHVRTEHPDAWKKIHKEPNPRRLEKRRRWEDGRGLARKAREEVKRRELDRAKLLWIKLGGDAE